MLTELEERVSRPFMITNSERELLYQYHSGQNSMLYACASSNGLRLGSNEPPDCKNEIEWMRQLLRQLRSELWACVRIAETDAESGADRPALLRLANRVGKRVRQIELALDALVYIDIDEVIEHYIETALQASSDELRISADLTEGDPVKTEYGREDLSREAELTISAEISAFVRANSLLLLTWSGEGDTSVEEQTAHDFWFTRNGDGVGFWEPEWGDVGQKLTEAAQAFGEMSLTVTDDGQIDIL